MLKKNSLKSNRK